jgi:hypothetical protein
VSAGGGADEARVRADLAFALAHPAGLRTLDLRRGEAELARLEGRLDEARRLHAELARIAPDAEAPPALAALALAESDPDEAFRQAMSSVDFMRGLAPAYAAERGPMTSEEGIAAAVRQHARSADGLVRIEGLSGRYTDWDARLAERRSTAAAHAQRALGELRRAARLERGGELEKALAALAVAGEFLAYACTIAPDWGEARLDALEVEGERARVLTSLGRDEEARAARERVRSALEGLEGSAEEAVRARAREMRARDGASR